MPKENNDKISSLQQKLYDGAVAIQQESAKDANAIKFMARSMILATLPHLDPGDIPNWGRNNGKYSLNIQPGYMIDERGKSQSLGIPYGVIPRLLLCWLTTEAVRTKEREIIMGRNLSDFLKKLDMTPTGGRKGSITRVKNQTIRLFSSSISCVYSGEEGFARRMIPIADSTYLLWDPKNPDQISLWNSTVTLGQAFFDEIISRPVPIDFRALKALKNSPLSLDLYTWLTYRLSYLSKPSVISWESLAAQFGSDYTQIRFFKRRLKESLQKVQIVYKDANVSLLENGLLLKPSKTSVSIAVCSSFESISKKSLK